MEATVSGSDVLAPELLEAALAENRYVDTLRVGETAAMDQARTEAYVAEQARKEAALEAIKLLSEDETLVGYDLIKAYGDLLEHFGEMYRLRQLEEMCKIGDKLVPGEVFFANDCTVKTVAGERSETAASVAMPEIYSNTDRTTGNAYHRFAWRVTVVGSDQSVRIESADVAVGRLEVKQQLDLFSTRSGSSFEGLMGTVADYDAIGAEWESETYRLLAAGKALDRLKYDRFMSQCEITEVIGALGEGRALGHFINELAERVVRVNPNITDFQHLNIVRGLVTYEKRQNPTASRAAVTTRDILVRYLDLEELGRQRREQNSDIINTTHS